MKFRDIKPGDIFRTSSNVWLMPGFDIFMHDRVIRTRKEDAAMAVIIGGTNSGKYDGVFHDDDDVDLLLAAGDN